MNRLPSYLSRLLSHLCVAALAAAFCVPKALPQEDSTLPALTADQIVAQLMQRNDERAGALEHYTSHRRYHLDYQGFPGARDATMEVEADFDAPASKRFTIVSETGSKLILNRVFRRLLESEQEPGDAGNRTQTALTTANYVFSSAGTAGASYILTVEPREDSKYLYRGKIWVDGHDFAVTRIEAEPAKNPSFWTTKSEIQHTYEKVDNYFYLPRQNKTVTNTRLGGVATLTIEYLSYDVTASPKAAAGEATKLGSEAVVDPNLTDLKSVVAGLK